MQRLEHDIANPLRQLTNAAQVVEQGEEFDPATTEAITSRSDELGQLARVFSKMAVEVQAREKKLKKQVEELRIEIDTVKRKKQVAEITETDFFRDLQAKAREQRAKRGGAASGGESNEETAADTTETT